VRPILPPPLWKPFQNEQAKAVMEKYIPGLTMNPQTDQATDMLLQEIASSSRLLTTYVDNYQSKPIGKWISATVFPGAYLPSPSSS
jgi:hypothetical protein